MDSETLSDSETVPQVNIFEARINNIWKENLDLYNKTFTYDDDEIEEEKSEKKEDEVIEKEDDNDEFGILDAPAKKLLKEIEERKQERLKNRKGRKRKKPVVNKASNCNSVVKLTASAKRRIREIELETEREARRIEEENKLVFAKCDKISSLTTVENVEDINRDISLKVRYQLKISKVIVKEKEEFKSIFQKVADLYGLKPTGILLCLGDNNIKLTDTPESLNIRICDVIDCIPYEEEGNANSSNMLLLKIQSNDTRKKTEIHSHKLEKFHEVMKKYADIRKLPLDSLTFEFDGEVIQPDETPVDLEMESGSCIDVKVAVPKESNKKTKTPQKRAKRVPPLPMMDVVELD